MPRKDEAASMRMEVGEATGNTRKIGLKTEPSKNIPGFILANAQCRECERAYQPHPRIRELGIVERCECDEPRGHDVVEPEEGLGRSVIICGSGPSLKKVAQTFHTYEDTDIWGCNRALGFLHEWGVPVTHGVAIDPSVRMFTKIWRHPVPDVEYLLATTVNPGLVWHLEECGLPVRYFHSLRGAPGEIDLYQLLYPPTVLTGNGLNVVNRAVDMAEFMGYDPIYIAGADSAFGPGDTLHADGSGLNPGDYPLDGVIDGREWRTKADMLMSAVALVQRRHALGHDRVQFLGDVLPRALQDKPEAFLKRVVEWRPPEE